MSSTKLKGVGKPKSPSMLGTVMQSLEFAQRIPSIALVWYFPLCFFPPFWDDNVYPVPLYVKSMRSSCLILVLQGLELRDYHEILKRLWTLNSVGTEIDYGDV